MIQATDPYTLLQVPIEEEGDAQDQTWAAMDEAIRCFDPSKPEPLISLLRSDHWLLRRRGLHIFASMGKKAFVALDAALCSANDSDEMARADLMDGIMSFSSRLSPHQAQVVLKLAGDVNELVRFRVVVFLAVAEREVIASAIGLLDPLVRLEYQQAFLMFDADPLQAQSLFDQYLGETSVMSSFALASIERMVREHRLSEAPSYSGDGFIGQSLVANSQRLLRNQRRAAMVLEKGKIMGY